MNPLHGTSRTGNAIEERLLQARGWGMRSRVMGNCHLYAPRYFLRANCVLCLTVKVPDKGIRSVKRCPHSPVKLTSEGEAQTLQAASI